MAYRRPAAAISDQLAILLLVLVQGVQSVYFTQIPQRVLLPTSWDAGRDFLQLHCLDELNEDIIIDSASAPATNYRLSPESDPVSDLFEVDARAGTMRTKRTLVNQQRDKLYSLVVECTSTRSTSPKQPPVTLRVNISIVSEDDWLAEVCDLEKMCFHKELNDGGFNDEHQQLLEVHENSGPVVLADFAPLWSSPSACFPVAKTTYSFTESTGRPDSTGQLTMNDTTGELSVLLSLDREKIAGNVLRLTVDCLATISIPASSPRPLLHKDSFSVRVAVRDTNDNGPKIVGKSCAASDVCPFEVDMSTKSLGENFVANCMVADIDDSGVNNYSVTLRNNDLGYFKLGQPVTNPLYSSVDVLTRNEIPPSGTTVDVVWTDLTFLSYGSNETAEAVCRISITSHHTKADYTKDYHSPEKMVSVQKSATFHHSVDSKAMQDMPVRNSYDKEILAKERLSDDIHLKKEANSDTIVALKPSLAESVKPPQRRCDSTCKLIIVASLCGTTLMMAVAAVSWRIHRHQKSTPKGQLGDKNLGSVVSLNAVPSDYVEDTDRPTGDMSPRNTNYAMYDSKWEFPRKDLVLDKTLGEGEFGRVLRGRARNIAGKTGVSTVAVKMLKECATSSELRDLMSEYNLLKEVNHKNVIKLLGACTKKSCPVYVIVEYCQYGCLRSYLRKCRHPGSSYFGWDSNLGGIAKTRQVVNGVISPKDLLSFAWQTANGMQYLCEMKLVHRDLAARNVLLAAGKIIKISDFGLSRDVYERDTYMKKSRSRIPVKWMAPESLYDGIYTSRSDVWSFGVVLWEIVTLGATPYPGIPAERLYNMVKTGYRMDKPENCSNELYNVMTRCWQMEYFNRPSFKYLGEILERMLRQNVDYLDLGSSIERNPITDDDTTTEKSSDEEDDFTSEPREPVDPVYGSINILPMDKNDYVMTPHAQYVPESHAAFENWSERAPTYSEKVNSERDCEGDRVCRRQGRDAVCDEPGSFVSNENSQLLNSSDSSLEMADPKSRSPTAERDSRRQPDRTSALNYLAVETVI